VLVPVEKERQQIAERASLLGGKVRALARKAGLVDYWRAWAARSLPPDGRGRFRVRLLGNSFAEMN